MAASSGLIRSWGRGRGGSIGRRSGELPSGEIFSQLGACMLPCTHSSPALASKGGLVRRGSLLLGWLTLPLSAG